MSEAHLTPDDVRHFLLDRSVEDNQLDLDLAFSEPEIIKAMQRAAREYNSLAPFTDHVDAACLSLHTNIFLDATAEQLYLAALAKLMRNDVDYEAGGVTVQLEKKRIEHFKDLIKLHRERWQEPAKSRKVMLNLRHAYGRVG